MRKSALVVISSLFFAFASASIAEAASAPAPASLEKPVKKTGAKHRVAKKTVSAKVSHASARRISTVSLNKNERLLKQTVVVRGRRHTGYQRVSIRPSLPVVPPIETAGDLAGLNLTQDPLALKSNVAYVIDQASSKVLFEKNANVALPIASVTKLMTATVVVEAHQNMEEMLTVTDEDVDREKFSSSRLRVGSRLSRDDMLHIALMSSENRAASALSRYYPGGKPAFVAAMNMKARSLGMNDTHYYDPTGLDKNNVASAHDLAKLVVAAYQYPLIRNYSTDIKYSVEPNGHSMMQYGTSNSLVRNKDWDIGLQKTGFINEAGHCLVMQTRIDGRQIVMVFLDSKGKYSHVADASRMRQWLTAQNIRLQQNLTRLASKVAQS
ncbi:MAG: dacC [Herbaspirillum sp.]|nr:dacC [Herbaspirillum sp.]